MTTDQFVDPPASSKNVYPFKEGEKKGSIFPASKEAVCCRGGNTIIEQSQHWNVKRWRIVAYYGEGGGRGGGSGD